MIESTCNSQTAGNWVTMTYFIFLLLQQLHSCLHWTPIVDFKEKRSTLLSFQHQDTWYFWMVLKGSLNSTILQKTKTTPPPPQKKKKKKKYKKNKQTQTQTRRGPNQILHQVEKSVCVCLSLFLLSFSCFFENDNKKKWQATGGGGGGGGGGLWARYWVPHPHPYDTSSLFQVMAWRRILVTPCRSYGGVQLQHPKRSWLRRKHTFFFFFFFGGGGWNLMKSHPVLGKLAFQNRPRRAAYLHMAIGGSAKMHFLPNLEILPWIGGDL